MSQPRVPGDDENTLELPCGQTMVAGELDLGMREFKSAIAARRTRS